jgi:hypothetical protein
MTMKEAPKGDKVHDEHNDNNNEEEEDVPEDGSTSSGLLNRNNESSTESASGGAPSCSGDSLRSGSTRASQFGRARDMVGDTLTKSFSNDVCSVRILILLLFLTLSIYIPMVIYRTSSKSELESFQRKYDDWASKIINSFDFRMAQQLQAMDSIDISMTSYASHSSGTYPKVTMPDFDLGAANTLALAGTAAIWLVPLVNMMQGNNNDTTAEQLRKDWEEYSVEHQDWIDVAVHRELPKATENNNNNNNNNNKEDEDRGRRRAAETLGHRIRRKYGQRKRARNLATTNDAFTDQDLNGIAEEISEFGETGALIPQPEGSTGPYFPIWQNTPAVEDVVNINLLSMSTFQASLTATVDSKLAVLGTVLEFSEKEELFEIYMEELVGNLNHEVQKSTDNLQSIDGRSEPISMLMYPIFDDFEKDEIVGLFAMTVYWHSFFDGVSSTV